jgi:uncharacterized protein YcbK (DUF882 family)
LAGKRGISGGFVLRALLGVLLSLAVLIPPVTTTAAPSIAGGETRTLYLHHTHTGETGRFTFKRNGVYDQAVLRQLDVFLADWRTKDVIHMDPALFDLIWTIYQEVGATEPVNIVSSYRTPRTNAMLRAKSSGVAENSQHMKGKAMDIFIPGIKLATLRATAMRHQVGGVGYYPTSGSPFVHVDTGSVRAWPRMTRAQLEKVFPDGRTLHLPVDGKPLSSDGRRYAEAEWKKCHMVPCNGAPQIYQGGGGGNATVMVASAPVPATPSPGLYATIFGDAGRPAAPGLFGQEPTQRLVPTVSISAPVPATRQPAVAVAALTPMPKMLAPPGPVDPSAPIPATKSPAIRLATGPSIPAGGETALVALASIGAQEPRPRLLMTPKENLAVNAYVPAITPEPGAQRALEMIIERETTGALAPKLPAAVPAPAKTQVAALGSQPNGIDALASLLQDTWDAVSSLGRPPVANALEARMVLPPNPSFGSSTAEFTAPDIDHVAETMVQPVAMSAAFFGEMYEPEGYLDKTTELGPLVTRMGIDVDPTIDPYDRFVVGAPTLVAER